jgi:acetyltransferase-like isoleucine patch superfamily enzyme
MLDFHGIFPFIGANEIGSKHPNMAHGDDNVILYDVTIIK